MTLQFLGHTNNLRGIGSMAERGAEMSDDRNPLQAALRT
jgi:hypothetical protein